MALGETAGLKAAFYMLPLFVGATAALFLDPPKSKWAVPVLLMVFMGFGELVGPTLHTHLSGIGFNENGARMAAAALGWTTLKAAQRIIKNFNPFKKEAAQ
ncbi:MAG: hypothetical protein ACRCVX_12520 [Shewanella sp.]